jgi:iron complex transport system substrate-binding protein
MPASALALALRVASLNLCADEYLLLLAEPRQIVSVSYLARESLESPLWRKARSHHGNRGSLEDVLALRPSLVLTMGGGGRATALLAKRMGIRTLDVPVAASLADVATNLRTVGAALGHRERAESWVARLHTLERSTPMSAQDALWVSGGGISLTPGAIGSQWLRLAGLQQRVLPEGRVTLESLLTKPPKVLVRSNYRAGQMSGGARWLQHPIVQRAGARQLVTDGRPWTCMGPLMIPEIERLRRLAA